MSHGHFSSYLYILTFVYNKSLLTIFALSFIKIIGQNISSSVFMEPLILALLNKLRCHVHF